MADIRGDLIFNGFEPQRSAPHYLDGHDIALPPNSALEAAHASVPTIDSEPTAPIEDQWLDATSGAVISEVIEPNPSLVLCKARHSKVPDSSPHSEPPAPLPMKSDWAPIMEFAVTDIFQHSPFGNILNSLKTLYEGGQAVLGRQWDK